MSQNDCLKLCNSRFYGNLTYMLSCCESAIKRERDKKLRNDYKKDLITIRSFFGNYVLN